MSNERFYELAIPALKRAGFEIDQFPMAFVKAALDTCKGRNDSSLNSLNTAAFILSKQSKSTPRRPRQILPWRIANG
jgi:hypothetical protein